MPTNIRTPTATQISLSLIGIIIALYPRVSKLATRTIWDINVGLAQGNSSTRANIYVTLMTTIALLMLTMPLLVSMFHEVVWLRCCDLQCRPLNDHLTADRSQEEEYLVRSWYRLVIFQWCNPDQSLIASLLE